MKIVIAVELLNSIVEKCLGVDIEKVFVGVGFREGDVYKVVEVFECRNVSPNPRNKFVADPMCIYNIYRYAEGKGMDVVLLAHSHPAPPAPSPEDLRGMRLWGIPWLIIDSRCGDYGVWMLLNEDLIQVEVETTRSQT